MPIPQRILGRTGYSATILGLGGEGVLRTYGQEREAQVVIEAALAEGINYFETARAYSGSEAYLGPNLKRHRDKIFLTSKSHGRSFKEAMAHLTITLKNLDTDHLDLWQVHDIRTMDEVDALGAPGGALEAFHHARDRGWVRFIGITGHHDPAVLRRALQMFEFDTILLPVNPAEPAHASFLPLAKEAMDKGLGVIAMKTLCRGQLPQLAEESGAIVGELLAYAWSHPVTLAVVGADSDAQVRQLAAAARNFILMTPEEQQALEEAVDPIARQLMYYKP